MKGLQMTFGRKFWACLLALILVTGIFVLTLLLAREAIGPIVVVTFGSFIITVCFAYIGGNVWNKWVRSKYFKKDILDSDLK